MIKVLITAPRGKMDKLIVKVAAEAEDIEIGGAIGPVGRDYIGEDAGLVAAIGRNTGARVYDNIEDVIDSCDVVIDFSTTALSMEVVKACVAHGKPLMLGTTGFSPAQDRQIEEAAASIPLIKTANTSFIVNVMYKLLAEAAEKLYGKCKVEIIEMHDQNKVDAPSGTALEMAQVMTDASEYKPEDIDFHSVRAGDIPSSHIVLMGGRGERIEISHHAYNWECYAYGACEAARFLVGKIPGVYTMEDVIG